MRVEELEEYLLSQGINLKPDSINRSEQSVYNGYIYAFERSLKSDYYFIEKSSGEPYILGYNPDYLDKSKTETGKFPDSRKIKFDKCEKLIILDTPKVEGEGSLITEEVNFAEQFFARKTIGGSQIYYKLIGGKCVGRIHIEGESSSITFAEREIQGVNDTMTDLIPTSKSNYESALQSALKLK